MKKLTIKDFEKVEIGIGMPITYQHFTKDMRQVCLEPCLEGFCIGIYDDDEDLIGRKRCTNLKPESLESLKFGEEAHPQALEKALEIANEMLSVCTECGGNGEFIHDSADHRGEHVQSVDKCAKCNGTGRV